MGCNSCGGTYKPKIVSPMSQAMAMAEMEARLENKTYVVVQDGDKFFHECLECRQKSDSKHGIIIAYVR